MSVARCLFAVLLIALLSGMSLATAQEPVQYAGVVIRLEDDSMTYAYVPLDEPVTGIELLHKTGISLVTVSFGGLGEGVCKIENTGCEIGPCRTRMCQTADRSSPYWRYFQQDAQGNWIASPLGGSSTKIAPGEIDGWSWTPDDALLPEVTITDIPELTGAVDTPNEIHTAHYDANGKLMETGDRRELSTYTGYMLVFILVGVVAFFGVFLRFRPHNRT